MVQIVEITEDILKKSPNVINLLFELYGPSTIGLYAVLVDKELGFVGQNGAECVYIHKNGYNKFTLNAEKDLGALEIDGYDVLFGENLYFVNKEGIESFVELEKLDELDPDEYDGSVTYRQYNPETDTLCEIKYQHMYREMDNRPTIYGYHTRKINYLFIDEEYKKKPQPGKGLLPKRAKYYSKVEFDDSMIGHKLVEIRENGLIETLFSDGDRTSERNIVRYLRTVFIDGNGVYRDMWPLGEQLKTEELKELISSYGFSTELPWQLIEIYNGKDRLVNTVEDIVKAMKEVSKEIHECQDIEKVTKYAVLRLRNE